MIDKNPIATMLREAGLLERGVRLGLVCERPDGGFEDAKTAREFGDAPLYEIEGAIRGAVTDVIVACGNWSERRQREQTAATILAAIITRIDGIPTAGQILAATGVAVEAADALRAELAKPETVTRYEFISSVKP